jgi:hypothetical protein
MADEDPGQLGTLSYRRRTLLLRKVMMFRAIRKSGTSQEALSRTMPRHTLLSVCTAVLWLISFAALAQAPPAAPPPDQSSIGMLQQALDNANKALQGIKKSTATSQDGVRDQVATLDESLTEARSLELRLASGDESRSRATSRLLWLTGVFILLGSAALVILAIMVQRKYWGSSPDSDSNWRMYLMQLPLGAPEGSVRALVSMYVIVFGFLVLVMQNQLGLSNVDAIAGFVGIVITFYFTSRTNDQATKAVNSAVDAANKATTQAQTIATETQRTVVDAAQRAAVSAQSAAQSAAQPTAPLPAPDGAPSGGVTEAQSRLQGVKSDLQTGMLALNALSSLGVGSGIISGAQDITKTATGLLDAIDPLLSGSPDPAKLADVVGAAQDVLGKLENAGLPGALGDAVAGLGGTLGALSPLLAGVAGGPAGIVTGLVMTGVKLLQQKEKFDAWKNALLRAPLTRELMPATVDGTAALAALDPSVAPLMASRVGTPVPAQGWATDLMRKVLEADAAGDPLPAATIAAKLFAAGEPLGLHDKFQSAEELAEAITEYRSGIVFANARAQLTGSSIDVPAVGDQPAQTLDVGDLLTNAMKLCADPRAAAEIERLVYIVEALGKLGLGPDRLLRFVMSALGKGISLSTLGRQQTDQRQ